MKKFLLINGKQAYLKSFKDSETARTYVVNYFDHSKNVSYYEVNKLTVLSTNVDIT